MASMPMRLSKPSSRHRHPTASTQSTRRLPLALAVLLLATLIILFFLPRQADTPKLGAEELDEDGVLEVSKAEEEITMGFEKEIIRPGNGRKPARGQTVTVQCTGFGKNGDLNQKFWSTKDPGQEPFKFKIGLGQVIKGWDEGVLGMDIGEIARLKCSPDYAYGASGFPAWGIQPNSVLVFEIEVLSVA